MNFKTSCEGFVYEVVLERKQNVVSTVACVKGFLKPNTDDKSNKNIVDRLEKVVKNIVNGFVCDSEILSYNYIVDFECTKDNLNPDKWSRWKTDIYLMSEFVEREGELVSETVSLCEKVGNSVCEICEDYGFSQIGSL